MRDEDRWNHNLHYLPYVLDAVPPGARRALDIGCGEGTVTRRLRAIVPTVLGIDVDARSVGLARAHPDAGDIRYLLGDVLVDHDELAPDSFDVVTAVAVVHHLDPAAALRRMLELLRPGGVLVVIGLARWRLPADLPYVVAATAATAATSRLMRRRGRFWEHPSPVTEPRETFPQLSRLAAEHLPGAQLRRRLLWRYSLSWTKPQRPGGSSGGR
jgi:SAM-dependent methyltransferase